MLLKVLVDAAMYVPLVLDVCTLDNSDSRKESRRAQQAFSRVHARSALRWRPENRPRSS